MHVRCQDVCLLFAFALGVFCMVLWFLTDNACLLFTFAFDVFCMVPFALGVFCTVLQFLTDNALFVVYVRSWRNLYGAAFF